jgi:hypothetical protein
MSKSFILFPLVAGLCCLSACKKSGGGDGSTNAPATNTSGNPITAPVDYLGAVGKAKQSSERTLTTLGINQAIQTFYGQEGRYPKDLNELVSRNYLSQLPKPPTGTKFDYNPQTGQVKAVPQ